MITDQERNELIQAMRKLLEEYNYPYEVYALDTIIDEWANQKADLIEAFKRHPKYIDGKFMIAFDSNYEREFDKNAVINFADYLEHNVMGWGVGTLPEDINQQRIDENKCYLPDRLYLFFAYLTSYINSRTISEETAKLLEEIIPQIHPHPGEKSSRVINRLCTYLNYHKHPAYNREFAKFADGLNPLMIKRHTVLSINPLDYLTMSFGNSWASCHTIDKQNKRGMPNDYSGCYSSGTVSYMLDKVSMVFYTVDAAYNGNEYYNEPKINRQMFHYGEDKLVQGRLYPQCNDEDTDTYKPYRNIVQDIMSVIFDFPNLWICKKGVENIRDYVFTTCGATHYEDYFQFNACSVSLIKGRENEQRFNIGAEPICIECSCRHNTTDNINCCNSEYRICESCGKKIYDGYEYWVGDYCYCEDCVSYCEDCGHYELNSEGRHVESVYRWVCDCCLDEYYTYCEDCEEYYPNNDVRWVESVDKYVCYDCLRENYTQCYECGEYYPDNEVAELHGHYYCRDCYNEKIREEEEMVEDDE